VADTLAFILAVVLIIYDVKALKDERETVFEYAYE
jgi:hypothetical protein